MLCNVIIYRKNSYFSKFRKIEVLFNNNTYFIGNSEELDLASDLEHNVICFKLDWSKSKMYNLDSGNYEITIGFDNQEYIINLISSITLFVIGSIFLYQNMFLPFYIIFIVLFILFFRFIWLYTIKPDKIFKLSISKKE